jgi:hypothetical protein
MYIVDCNRSKIFDILNECYRSSGFRPRAAEIGVLRGDNADEILAKIPLEHLYLIDDWSVDSLADYLMLSKKRRWMRPISSLSGYFGGSVESQETFTKLYAIVCKKFAGRPNVSVIRTNTNKLMELIGTEELPKAIDYIYLDAGHQYEQVLDDLIDCAKWLSHKGIIQCNDVLYGESGLRQNLGVQDAINKFTRFSGFKPILLSAREGGDVLLTRDRRFEQLIRTALTRNKLFSLEVPDSFIGAIGWTKTGITLCTHGESLTMERNYFETGLFEKGR